MMIKEVDKYINKQSSPQKEIMIKIRSLLRDLIPKAEEKMSYGVPAFKQKKLINFQTSKGAIKFMLDIPIPYNLIEKIVRYKFKI
jgi:uncharacterized protein YdhG (YjbR/CyaY superfamily)